MGFYFKENLKGSNSWIIVRQQGVGIRYFVLGGMFSFLFGVQHFRWNVISFIFCYRKGFGYIIYLMFSILNGSYIVHLHGIYYLIVCYNNAYAPQLSFYRFYLSYSSENQCFQNGIGN